MKSEKKNIIIQMMIQNNKDRRRVSEKLGVSSEELDGYIEKDPTLNAMFGDVGDANLEQVQDDQGKRDLEDSADLNYIEVVNANNQSLLSQGFEKAGISRRTLDKIQILGEFEQNAGRFLVGSMDLMHRLIVYGGVQLFEDLEYIREQLRNAETQKEKLMWQRAFNATFDQLQKANRDIQAGTLAMVKMTKKKDKDDVKKPGFKPLTK